MNIAILVERDHIADALKRLLKTSYKCNIVIDSADLQDVMRKLAYTRVDLVMMEAELHDMDALEIISNFKKEFPALRFMVIAEEKDAAVVESLIQGDLVNAYLPAQTTKKELFDALAALMDNDIYFAKTIVDLLSVYRKQKRGIASSTLKKRELEIMRFLLENKSVQQISDELIISEKTIEHHRKNIYLKANAQSIDELIEFASRQKLLD